MTLIRLFYVCIYVYIHVLYKFFRLLFLCPYPPLTPLFLLKIISFAPHVPPFYGLREQIYINTFET